MAGIFYPGIILLGIAFILNILVSISLPYVRIFDIVRTTFGESGGIDSTDSTTTQVRWGIWGVCIQLAQSGDWACVHKGHGYGFTVGDETVGASWTRGLVVHVIATGVTLIAWLLACSKHFATRLVAMLVAFLAALLTLIAFAIDIALFTYVKNKMDDIPDVSEKTMPGPGFWMTLAAFLVTVIGGCFACFGRRKHHDEVTYATKKPWYHKFRRNRY